ncbi:hypothetical protein [Comamonas jiangduensis]|uniref:Uncharacterized protein n=1 Tax=Comamonas jiangduensis TaxID=1194168 RepID=A0ABV4ICC6_9BURK
MVAIRSSLQQPALCGLFHTKRKQLPQADCFVSVASYKILFQFDTSCADNTLSSQTDKETAMKQCIIKVAGARYTALFPSTCAALEDALKRFPGATAISVKTA